MVDIEARGDFEKPGERASFGDWDVGNDTAGFADEVPVIGQVGAVTGGLSFDIDLFGEAAFHKGLEAVVNRGQRNSRNALLGSYENFCGRRVIAVREQHIINFAPLRGEAMAVMADRFLVGGLNGFFRGHASTSNLPAGKS